MSSNPMKSETNNNSSKNAKKGLRKGDMILLAILAVIGVVIAGIYGVKTWQQNQLHTSDSTYYVQVDVNNRAEALLPVSVDGEFTFSNIYSKGENVLHIKDGKVSMHSANCPDQVCVYQGELEPPTIVPIVCMPNVVYVSILERSEIDWSLIREEIVPEALKEDYAAYHNAK